MGIAYTAQGIIQLAVAAPDVLPAGFLGVNSLPVGDVIKIVGVPLGMFIWGIGFWFFAVATVSNLTGIKEPKFTLNCWAFIFPNAGLALALLAIGNALDSNGIRGVVSGLTIVLVAVWLAVAVGNIRAVVKREVLWPGKDEDNGWMEKSTHEQNDDQEAGNEVKND
jgi:tellurite resistance protein TehA-like permease